MPADLRTFRERAACAAAKADRAAGDADRYTRMADAVIAELAKPIDAMIDAAYEVVRFDEAWRQLAARLQQSREGDGPNSPAKAGPKWITPWPISDGSRSRRGFGQPLPSLQR